MINEEELNKIIQKCSRKHKTNFFWLNKESEKIEKRGKREVSENDLSKIERSLGIDLSDVKEQL